MKLFQSDHEHKSKPIQFGLIQIHKQRLKGFNIHPKIHKATQQHKYCKNPLPWRMSKSRAKPRPSQRPRGARGRPAGLGDACRPPSGPSRPPILPMLHSTFVLPPEKWITDLLLILGCLVDLWINVNAFQCIQLNRGPTLDSEPHECVSLPMV